MKKRTFVVILLLVSGLALSIRCLPIIPMRFVYNVWIDHEQRLVCCFPRELDNYSIGRLVKILELLQIVDERGRTVPFVYNRSSYS